MEVGIRNDLIFGTVSANDYGIFISGEGVYNAPERVVELLDVPGRNGALTIDKGHYGNITIEYPAFTFANSQAEFRRKLNAYKNAIMSQVGYQKLSDTYHPDEYRLGMFVEGLEVEPVAYGRSGSFTLKFNCKPQRYLADGQQAITIEDEDIVVNPTLYESSPLLMVEGYGDIAFNGYTISLENAILGQIQPPSKKTQQAQGNNSITFNYGNKFNTGDTLSVKIVSRATMNVNGNMGSSHTETQSGATASSIVIDQSGTHLFLGATFNKLNYTVGTSSTTNYTLQSSLQIDGSSYVIKLHLTIVFNGVSKFTITTYSEKTSGGTAIRVDYTTLEVSGFTATSTISLLGNPTYIDCDIGEAYKFNSGTLISLNAHIDLGSDLPKLGVGENPISIDNTVTELKLVPRWWEL